MTLRPAIILLLAVLAGAGPLSAQEVLWSAGHEGGVGLSEWGDGSGASGGGFFNSGNFTVATSATKAHSGLRSMKATINTSTQESAVRAFRWEEAQTGQALFYSVWAYWPQRHVPEVFWNVLQFKSERLPPNDHINSPILTVNIDNKGVGGAMRLHVVHHKSFFGGVDQKFQQTLRDLPVGNWVHLEAYLKQSGGTTGVFRLWQNGVKIFDIPNIKTRYTDGDNQWSVDNYSSGLSPDLATIYFDDAVIATVRQGP